MQKMFQIDAVFQNGQKIPWALAYTTSAASSIAEHFRKQYIYGKKRPALKDFTVSPVNMPQELVSAS